MTDDEKTYDLDEAIDKIATSYGVPRSVWERMRRQESGGDHGAVSPKGASSAWQIMPATAKALGVDLNDPLQAAEGGLRYLRDNYKQFRDKAENEKHAWMLAVAAYHGGPGGVQDAFKRGLPGGLSDRSDGSITTRDHVLKIFDGLEGSTLDRSPLGNITNQAPAVFSNPDIAGEDMGSVSVGQTPSMEDLVKLQQEYAGQPPPRLGQMARDAAAEALQPEEATGELGREFAGDLIGGEDPVGAASLDQLGRIGGDISKGQISYEGFLGQGGLTDSNESRAQFNESVQAENIAKFKAQPGYKQLETWAKKNNKNPLDVSTIQAYNASIADLRKRDDQERASIGKLRRSDDFQRAAPRQGAPSIADLRMADDQKPASIADLRRRDDQKPASIADLRRRDDQRPASIADLRRRDDQKPVSIADLRDDRRKVMPIGELRQQDERAIPQLPAYLERTAREEIEQAVLKSGRNKDGTLSLTDPNNWVLGIEQWLSDPAGSYATMAYGGSPFGAKPTELSRRRIVKAAVDEQIAQAGSAQEVQRLQQEYANMSAFEKGKVHAGDFAKTIAKTPALFAKTIGWAEDTLAYLNENTGRRMFHSSDVLNAADWLWSKSFGLKEEGGGQAEPGDVPLIVADAIERALPDDPRTAGTTLGVLSRASGSAVPFLVGATLSGGSTAVIAMMGIGMQTGEMYGQAKDAGLSREKALLAGATGIPIGASEVFGLKWAKLGELIQKRSGGQFTKSFLSWLTNTGREASEETLQEYFQSSSSKAVIQALKNDGLTIQDIAQILGSSVKEAAAGGVVGALFGGGVPLISAGIGKYNDRFKDVKMSELQPEELAEAYHVLAPAVAEGDTSVAATLRKVEKELARRNLNPNEINPPIPQPPAPLDAAQNVPPAEATAPDQVEAAPGVSETIPESVPLVKGSQVLLNEGPDVDYEAEIVSINKKKQRATIKFPDHYNMKPKIVPLSRLQHVVDAYRNGVIDAANVDGIQLPLVHSQVLSAYSGQPALLERSTANAVDVLAAAGIPTVSSGFFSHATTEGLGFDRSFAIAINDEISEDLLPLAEKIIEIARSHGLDVVRHPDGHTAYIYWPAAGDAKHHEAAQEKFDVFAKDVAQQVTAPERDSVAPAPALVSTEAEAGGIPASQTTEAAPAISDPAEDAYIQQAIREALERNDAQVDPAALREEYRRMRPVAPPTASAAPQAQETPGTGIADLDLDIPYSGDEGQDPDNPRLWIPAVRTQGGAIVTGKAHQGIQAEGEQGILWGEIFVPIATLSETKGDIEAAAKIEQAKNAPAPQNAPIQRDSGLTPLEHSMAARREESESMSIEDMAEALGIDPSVLEEIDTLPKRGDFGWLRHSMGLEFQDPDNSDLFAELVDVILDANPTAMDWAENGNHRQQKAVMAAIMDQIAQAQGKERSSLMNSDEWRQAIIDLGENLSDDTVMAMLAAGAATGEWHQNIIDFRNDSELGKLVEDMLESGITTYNDLEKSGQGLKIRTKILEIGRKYGKEVRGPNGLSELIVKRTVDKELAGEPISPDVRRSAARAASWYQAGPEGEAGEIQYAADGGIAPKPASLFDQEGNDAEGIIEKSIEDYVKRAQGLLQTQNTLEQQPFFNIYHFFNRRNVSHAADAVWDFASFDPLFLRLPSAERDTVTREQYDRLEKLYREWVSTTQQQLRDLYAHDKWLNSDYGLSVDKSPAYEPSAIEGPRSFDDIETFGTEDELAFSDDFTDWQEFLGRRTRPKVGEGSPEFDTVQYAGETASDDPHDRALTDKQKAIAEVVAHWKWMGYKPTTEGFSEALENKRRQFQNEIKDASHSYRRLEEEPVEWFAKQFNLNPESQRPEIHEKRSDWMSEQNARMLKAAKIMDELNKLDPNGFTMSNPVIDLGDTAFAAPTGWDSVEGIPERQQRVSLSQAISSLDGLSLAAMTKNHGARVDRGAFVVRPEGIQIIKRAIEWTKNTPQKTFTGVFLRAAQINGLRIAMEDMRRHLMSKITKDNKTASIAEVREMRIFIETFNKAVDAEYQDMIIVTDDGNNPIATANTRREEEAHRADFRIRMDQELPIQKFLMNDSYRRAALHLRRPGSIYKEYSDRGIHNEIVAKIFREDTQFSLGISEARRQEIQDLYIDQLLEAGITEEAIIEHFEGVDSYNAQEFIKQAKVEAYIKAGSSTGTVSQANTRGAAQSSREAPPGQTQEEFILGTAYQGTPNAFNQEVLVRDNRTGEQAYLEGTPEKMPFVPPGHEVIKEFPFGRHRNDKISTGQGVQTFGYGHYFADAEAVAREYRGLHPPFVVKYKGRYLEPFGPFKSLVEAIENNGNVEEALANQSEEARTVLQDFQLAPEDFQVFPNPRAGRLLRVDLKPNEEDYLLWDKPFNEQSPKVQKLIEGSMRGLTLPGQYTFESQERKNSDIEAVLRRFQQGGLSGGDFYNALSYALGTDGPVQQPGKGSRLAANALLALGIRGNKFLDADSRAAGDGTYNYVIFDPADVEITDIMFSGIEDEELEPEAIEQLADDITVKYAPKFIKEGDAPSAFEFMANWFRAGRLAAFGPLKTNIIGNPINVFVTQFVHPISVMAEYVDRQRTGRKGDYYSTGRTPLDILAGFKGAIVEGIFGDEKSANPGAWAALKSGVGDTDEMARYDMESYTLKDDEGKEIEKITGLQQLRNMPAVLRPPYIAIRIFSETVKRIFIAIDRPFAAFERAAERRALIRRHAKNLRRKDAVESWRKEMKRLIKNPNPEEDKQLLEDLEKLAVRAGRMATFQNKNLVTDLIGKGRQALLSGNWVGKDATGAERLIAKALGMLGYGYAVTEVPFVRTVSNVGLRTAEFHPLGAALQAAIKINGAYLPTLDKQGKVIRNKSGKKVWAWQGGLGRSLERQHDMEKLDQLFKKEHDKVKRDYKAERSEINKKWGAEKKKLTDQFRANEKSYKAKVKEIQTAEGRDELKRYEALAALSARMDIFKDTIEKEKLRLTKAQAAEIDESKAKEAEEQGERKIDQALVRQVYSAFHAKREYKELYEVIGRGGLGALMLLPFMTGLLYGLVEAIGYIDYDDEPNRWEAARDAGIPPTSVKIPGTGGYRWPAQLVPLTRMMFTYVTAAEQLQRPGTAVEKGMAAGKSTWQQGILTLNPFTDPTFQNEGGYLSPESLGNVATGFAPAILREAGEVMDEKARSTYKQGFTGAPRKMIPPGTGIGRETLPASNHPLAGRGDRDRRMLRMFLEPSGGNFETAPQSMLPVTPLSKEGNKGRGRSRSRSRSR
jgi:hypothetical protein